MAKCELINRVTRNIRGYSMKVLVLFLLFWFEGTRGLRNVRVQTPQAVQRGSNAVLRCLYDLEADILYSVKWYRGDREFCRYSPREYPPLKVFELSGIQVDEEESDSERLTLRTVSRAATGRYMCEVSADAPSFHTAQVNTSLVVVDLPPSGPVLRGIKPRYRIGTRLHGDCVCRDSMPPANLSFFINDVPAAANYVRHRIEGGSDGLMTASSSVQFLLHSRHFRNGKIKVRCTASIFNIYWRSTEKSVMEERDREQNPPPADSQRVAMVYPVQPAPTASISSSSCITKYTMMLNVFYLTLATLHSTR